MITLTSIVRDISKKRNYKETEFDYATAIAFEYLVKDNLGLSLGSVSRSQQIFSGCLPDTGVPICLNTPMGKFDVRIVIEAQVPSPMHSRTQRRQVEYCQ